MCNCVNWVNFFGQCPISAVQTRCTADWSSSCLVHHGQFKHTYPLFKSRRSRCTNLLIWHVWCHQWTQQRICRKSELLTEVFSLFTRQSEWNHTCCWSYGTCRFQCWSDWSHILVIGAPPQSIHLMLKSWWWCWWIKVSFIWVHRYIWTSV